MPDDKYIELIKSKAVICPKEYSSYDQRNDKCPICGQAKLYQMDRLNDDLESNTGACAGWMHDYGPVSCVSYVRDRLGEL